jgi:VIT1/CCC1 family predicted Fe2+/Mn2+ transporter
MFFETLGGNIAWGLVDAAIYILTFLTEKGHDRIILNFIRKTAQFQTAREYIADHLPPLIRHTLNKESLENIRKALIELPESSLKVYVTIKEIKKAIGIFLLMVIATFPVAMPFSMIRNVRLALHISNLLAIILMIICGWLLAKYSGFNKIIMSTAMALLGFAMVGITILLGG